MFTLEGFFNPYLPRGKNRLDAVLTSTADSGSAHSSAGQQRVVGFVMDVSGSMSGEKLYAAKIAARSGVDQLDADTFFFVVAYNSDAWEVVPVQKATARAKQEAHRAIQDLVETGATALSAGLRSRAGHPVGIPAGFGLFSDRRPKRQRRQSLSRCND